MSQAISKYASMVIAGNFRTLSQGVRNADNGIAFREISKVIRDIKFDDDHDQIILITLSSTMASYPK
jgi:hypothetical protein